MLNSLRMFQTLAISQSDFANQIDRSNPVRHMSEELLRTGKTRV